MKITLNKFLILSLFFLVSCKTENLKILAELPSNLKEVSGTEIVAESNLIWMVNDSGNSSELFGLDTKGNILKTVNIQAKNNDWEDLTSDKQGNLYIGDFGNNLSERTNLAILKIQANDLKNDSLVSVERISFYYENQNKFPAKKKQRYFDCEAFFHHNDSLYLFTKSRVKNNFGKTSLYKIPAKKGMHEAQFISSFNSCNTSDCWITSADINDDGKKVVLLTPKSVWLFTNFTNDDFLNGTTKELSLPFISQKESITFKDENTLYITDEKKHGSGGKLYEYTLK